jgi:ankyrin repeat protein
MNIYISFKKMSDCNCHASSNVNKSVFETLDELDFRRGLWSSAQQNDINELRERLESSNNKTINQCDSSGYTPLHYSVRFQPAHVCRLLLEHGANPNSQTRASQSTPLHRAIMFNNIDAVHHLLEYKADLTLKDIDGQTPIEKAMAINKDIANILLRSQKS